MTKPHVNKEAMEANIPADITQNFPRTCPRKGCKSTNITFRHFNNKHKPHVRLTQPRYVCNGCEKHFTRGGKLYKESPENPKPHAIISTSGNVMINNQKTREPNRATTMASFAFEEEPSNIESKLHEDINPPKNMDIDSEDETEAPSMNAHGSCGIIEKIHQHLKNALTIVKLLSLEKEALQKDFIKTTKRIEATNE